MFMNRIEAAAATPVKPRPLALKLGAGLAVTLVAAAAMLPWTLLVAAWAAAAMIATVAARTARATYAAILYAGEAVVGR
ncbi:MAG: hypothetical protein JOZ90_08585 [Alphaproteobacteria bacterium]|nr:hypothetical protein [Alphaproteobacteria bacterium]MBV9370930.1 hypothetical protein [Alphaproteobacteria bacterium]MBV9901140.1 hypothetical protein [Alphaproteobacteria bacterium]